MPLKYKFLRTKTPKRNVVWMRDPVERLASHYHYWKRSYDPQDAGSLHRRVIEEKWDIERFCLGPELRNIYSKFFWGFSLENFDFIGITEYYDTDIRYFAEEFLRSPLELEKVNVNPGNNIGTYIDDEAFRGRVEQYHRQDMQLYQRALDMRKIRRIC